MSRHPGVRPGLTTPRVRWAPVKPKSSDVADAVFLCSSYGLIPDGWQEPILRDWVSRRANGKWCYGKCGLAVPRQNGKNGIIEMRELWGMVELGEAFLHAAHEVKTTRKAFKRLKHFFGSKADDPDAKFPELNALVAEVRSTNGQEAIFLKDVYDEDGRWVRKGGSIEFVARSNGSGRGYTVDVLVLDEAQHLDDDELEAIRSAVSSAPLGNPQVIYAGTPPNREKGELGVVWLRIRAGAGKDKRLCWIEYGAPDGPLPDIDDIALLYATNPALEVRHGNGAFGLTMDVVRDERGELSNEGYARERYGWWGNPNLGHGGVIDMGRWSDLKVTVGPPARGLVVVDVSPDLAWTSIGVAADGPDGKVLVLVNRLEGTGGAVDKVSVAKVRDLEEDLDEVLEVSLTPRAKFLSAKLTKAGVEHKVLTTVEVGAGCTAFQEMVKERTVAHVGQRELDDDVRRATTRYVNGVQVWDVRDTSVDIASLVAGSVAAQRWAMLTAKPPEKRGLPRSEESRRSAPASSGGGVDIATVQW